MESNYNTFYSNAGGVFSSANDFIIRFAKTAPSRLDNPKSPFEKDVLDVYLSPKQFKKFIDSMKTQLAIYEKEYGEIKLPVKPIKNKK